MVFKLNQPPTESVRLHDVAALAKTSVATVSMALAGDQRISPETRQRIRRLSEKMGYRPRRSMRVALRRDAQRQQRMQVGFLALDRLDTTANAIMVQSLSATASANDIRMEIVSIARTTPADEVVDRAVQLGRTVDGLIIMGPVSLGQLRQIRSAGVSVVMFGYPHGDADEQDLPATIVTSDFQAMGQRATRTLLEAGHRRIAFVCGELLRGMWNERCLDGYLMAHAHADVPVEKGRIFAIPFNTNGAQANSVATAAAAAKVAAMPERPTAYVLINPGNAARFLGALRPLGVEVRPRDVVICGARHSADDLEALGYPLVYLDPGRMVEVALAQLRARCTDPSSPNAIVLVPFVSENIASQGAKS